MRQGPTGSGIVQHHGQENLELEGGLDKGREESRGREEAVRRRDTSRTRWGHLPDDSLTADCLYAF